MKRRVGKKAAKGWTRKQRRARRQALLLMLQLQYATSGTATFSDLTRVEPDPAIRIWVWDRFAHGTLAALFPRHARRLDGGKA